MAAADYKLCDVCNGKAFYDSNLNYEDERSEPDRPPFKIAGEVQKYGHSLGYLGDWAVLCDDCSKTHLTRIIKTADAGTVDAAVDLLDSLQKLVAATDKLYPKARIPGAYGELLDALVFADAAIAKAAGAA